MLLKDIEPPDIHQFEITKSNYQIRMEAAEKHKRDVIPRDDIRRYAYDKIVDNFGEEHWEAFDKLVNKESKWNPTAQNPTSTAYGIMQFLNSTWAGTGIQKTSDPKKQIDAGIIYLTNRYENPTNAWQHSCRNNWY